MNQAKPISTQDHIQGNQQKAVIELIEYGDYQCPYCGQAYPIVKKIQQRLGDKLLFVFRNFPLESFHPQAVLAAIAAEAAGKQGKFWEMHDIIYENQQALEFDDLVMMAKTIGLDVAKFRNAVETDQNLQEKVQQDFETGMRSGVNGTPSFFINGLRYDGDWSEEPFLEYLESVIFAQTK